MCKLFNFILGFLTISILISCAQVEQTVSTENGEVGQNNKDELGKTLDEFSKETSQDKLGLSDTTGSGYISVVYGSNHVCGGENVNFGFVDINIGGHGNYSYPYMVGDINGDAAIDYTDFYIAMRWSVGFYGLKGTANYNPNFPGYKADASEFAADVNRDTYFDIADVVLLSREVGGCIYSDKNTMAGTTFYGYLLHGSYMSLLFNQFSYQTTCGDGKNNLTLTSYDINLEKTRMISIKDYKFLARSGNSSFYNFASITLRKFNSNWIDYTCTGPLTMTETKMSVPSSMQSPKMLSQGSVIKKPDNTVVGKITGYIFANPTQAIIPYKLESVGTSGVTPNLGFIIRTGTTITRSFYTTSGGVLKESCTFISSTATQLTCRTPSNNIMVLNF